MLASLKIENVAVIEKAEVNFTPGFNVLTGETGAGKSILIDSINAILGNRTSRELVRSGAQKACIWATFESIPASVKKQLEKCGYEVTDDLLLYREINAEGKGSCRVNGMPATAAVVRDISSGLLSIHGQHDSQSLTNPALHLGLLDQYAQNRYPEKEQVTSVIFPLKRDSFASPSRTREKHCLCPAAACAAGVTALQSRYFWGTAYKRSRNEKIPAACKASDRFFPIPVRDASSMIYSTETR